MDATRRFIVTPGTPRSCRCCESRQGGNNTGRDPALDRPLQSPRSSTSTRRGFQARCASLGNGANGGSGGGVRTVMRCVAQRRKSQIPPDLVVKFQPIDIADVIL